MPTIEGIPVNGSLLVFLEISPFGRNDEAYSNIKIVQISSAKRGVFNAPFSMHTPKKMQRI